MSFQDDREQIGELIDRYVAAWPARARRLPAATTPGSWGVPPEMWVGPIDPSGWVEWQVLPSTVAERDVAAIESAFDVRFPDPFRGYLAARFHCLDQLRSVRHGQSVLWPGTPAGDPFRRLRTELEAWRPLIAARLIPFAEWGDGYGPMCFDPDGGEGGDRPVVWLDHEHLSDGTEAERLGSAWVRSLSQPLYASSQEMIDDLFTPRQR